MYPLDKEIGGSLNLLSCYETFGIEITLNEMHEKCTSIFEDDMSDNVSDYHICLQDLGS